MRKRCTLALALAASFALAAPTLSIDGKTVALPTALQGGKVFVDAQALARALGASVSYDPAAQRVVIVTGPSPAGAQGSGQLPGGAGQFGKTYALGQRSALNFTLKSAEYRVAPINIGSSLIAPEANEKLLVLHYSVQNPQKTDVRYYWNALRFTGVDAQDVNHNAASAVAREGSRDALEIDLKPAQKVDAYAVLKVPAAGAVPKLLVERGDGSPVLRYNLRGQVKALSAPFADPQDASGTTARPSVPATPGTFFPGIAYDLKLESVAFTTEPLGGRAPQGGRRYLVATVALKNTRNADQEYYWGTLRPELRDADGELVEWNSKLLKAGRDEDARARLKPGEEARVRFFFELPQDRGAKSLTLKEGAARAYEFDLGGVK